MKKRRLSKSELKNRLAVREYQLNIFFFEHMDHSREDRKEWIYAASKLTKVAPENFNKNDVEVGSLIRKKGETKFVQHCKQFKIA